MHKRCWSRNTYTQTQFHFLFTTNFTYRCFSMFYFCYGDSASFLRPFLLLFNCSRYRQQRHRICVTSSWEVFRVCKQMGADCWHSPEQCLQFRGRHNWSCSRNVWTLIIVATLLAFRTLWLCYSPYAHFYVRFCCFNCSHYRCQRHLIFMTPVATALIVTKTDIKAKRSDNNNNNKIARVSACSAANVVERQ